MDKRIAKERVEEFKKKKSSHTAFYLGYIKGSRAKKGGVEA